MGVSLFSLKTASATIKHGRGDSPVCRVGLFGLGSPPTLGLDIYSVRMGGVNLSNTCLTPLHVPSSITRINQA